MKNYKLSKRIFNALLILLITFISSNIATAQITYENAFPGVKFVRPVEIQNSNDGTNRMFVVEQAGIIKVFNITNNVTSGSVSTFLDITDRVYYSAGQELGLLGLAFHPNYASNGYLYVYYTTESPVSGISTRMVLSRFSVNSGNNNSVDLNSELILFQFDKNQNNSNHNGGKIAFGPEGHLYISFGDGGGGNDPSGNGQNINTVFGSICRIDVDLDGSNPIESNPVLPNGNYEIPSDNPFVGVSGLDEIYAYGIRNTWKFSFDSVTGRLWGADVGQGKFEEINLIENGENYGWSRFEGTSVVNGGVTINEPTTFPVFFYDRSQGDVSITGGYVYRGSEITSTNPSIHSNYIYADYVSGRVWSLDYNESLETTTNTFLFKTNGLAISSFGTDEAGELYFSSYSTNAEIYKLVDGTSSSSGTVVNGVGNWNSLQEGITNGIIEAIATDTNDNVYVGGAFNQAGTVAANNIALWNDTAGWQAIGSGTNGTVNAVKVDANGNVYIGGSFTQVNGVNAVNVARYNGSQWSAVGTGINGIVATLEIDSNNNMYAGGIFNMVNGNTANNIAFYNGSQWSALTDATSGQAGTNNEIRSLAIDSDGTLYVGGNFDEAGGKTANRIATWNGTDWGTLGEGTSGFVEAIATTSTDIYLAGNFISAGGITVNRIAKWDKNSSNFSALGNGVNNSVSALLHDGTNLYAAGNFDVASNNSSENYIVNHIARWSTVNNWEALGENTNVGVDIKINAMTFSSVTTDNVYVGGNFSEAGGINMNNVALWSSDGVLNLESISNQKEIVIYPNPSSEIINISKSTNWTLYDMMSRTVKHGNNNSIDISNFKNGIYFLKVDNNRLVKIIKN